MQEDSLNISYFAGSNGALSLAGCVRAPGSVVVWPGTLWGDLGCEFCLLNASGSYCVRIDKHDARLGLVLGS